MEQNQCKSSLKCRCFVSREHGFGKHGSSHEGWECVKGLGRWVWSFVGMGRRSKNEATVRIGPKIVMCKCFVSEITESPRDGSQKILNAHCLPAKSAFLNLK